NAVPSRVRALLRRCLQKDPARRLRDIADARFELEDDEDPESPQTTTGRPSINARIGFSLALMAAVAAISLGAFVYTRPAPAPPQIYRSSLLPPDGVN